MNVFMEPMKKKRIISEEMLMCLFGNIPALANINKVLLESLHEAVKYDSPQPDYENANLGAVLLKFCPFFKMYSNYCKTQKNAATAYRDLKKISKFSKFVAECRKNRDTRSMELPVRVIHVEGCLLDRASLLCLFSAFPAISCC